MFSRDSTSVSITNSYGFAGNSAASMLGRSERKRTPGPGPDGVLMLHSSETNRVIVRFSRETSTVGVRLRQRKVTLTRFISRLPRRHGAVVRQVPLRAIRRQALSVKRQAGKNP